MIKKSMGLLAALFLTLLVFTANAQLRGDHPDTYTVRRGDTLWAIASKFLSKPWLWPEIWQANPQVKNPRLIYPGDVLSLSSLDGHAALRLQPAVHVEAVPVPAIPLSAMATFLKDQRVLDEDVVKRLPYVVGLEEMRLRSVAGQNIYARGDAKGMSPGQRYLVVRPSHVFRDVNDDQHAERLADELDNNVRMVPSPWLEDFRNNGHNVFAHGKMLGVEVSVIATAEVARSGDPSTLLLLDTKMEIRHGDRLMPLDEMGYDPYFYPHAPQNVSPAARVIAFTEALDAAGGKQVVALSIGQQDGVENGQVYSIWQPGEEVHDDVTGDGWHRGGEGPNVKLPDEFVGHAMVFRTFGKVSYALVMDDQRPVHLGNKLTLPE